MEVHGGLDVRRPSKKFKSPASNSLNTSASKAGGLRNLHLQAPYMRGSSRVFRISRRSTKRRPFGTSWMILRRATPMDRVICSDVGFGKTGGEHCERPPPSCCGNRWRLPCPRTVLARQHVATFRKRFAPFNIEVGSLSRTASSRGDKGGEGGAKEWKIESRGRNARLYRLQGCEVRRPGFGNHRRGAAFWGG